MNFITANNKHSRGKKPSESESFLSVLISVAIITTGFLLMLAVVFSIGWVAVEAFNIVGQSTAYESLNPQLRFVIESFLIIVGGVIAAAALVWANIKSKNS